MAQDKIEKLKNLLCEEFRLVDGEKINTLISHRKVEKIIRKMNE